MFSVVYERNRHGIFNIQTVLDVEKFSIGGEPAKYPAFMEYLRRNLEKLYGKCPLIGALQCWLAENI